MRKKSKHASKETLQTTKENSKRRRKVQKDYKTSRKPIISCCCSVAQSCPTLCDPIDGSPSGSPVPGILQARTLEWVAIFFSNAWKLKVKVKSLSHIRLFGTSWTAAYQSPLSMGFSRQEYWRRVPLPCPIPINNSLNGSRLNSQMTEWPNGLKKKKTNN